MSPAGRAADLSSLLAGVRVVTIAQNAPGPLAVQRLAQHGASVCKIEPPEGDPLLTISPSWHAEMHVGVTIERLDLKTSEGQAALREHLATAQVFITSQRPAALTRLGLDPRTLLQRYPTLRVLRIVGSLDAPDDAGHDLTYQAAAGLIGAAMPLALVADVMTSERAYAGVLALLRMDEGHLMDIGMVESLAPMQATLRHGLTVPNGILGGGLPRYMLYECREGQVAVAALEPHFAARLRDELGTDDQAIMAVRFLERTATAWEEWAKARDLPIAAVRATNPTWA
ncbi:MAG TPA: CoA transferase [Gemmatimonas aurantiaca]|uniref:Fatty acid-CoA racemase n=2 Tax=Gemmatimonas aurantiaca TaxID=173480 RepID=C1A6H9_GEMAT|nr:CoA transferase [Gemmatimonas aurantiaca]BAH37839.1 fatty acid-CoA racemase [Gemmatimonas aurantiaca T-27]HCT56615.1 CoA transferase [Gemmatimonas aurantiaca]